jgi:hypothetical protein
MRSAAAAALARQGHRRSPRPERPYPAIGESALRAARPTASCTPLTRFIPSGSVSSAADPPQGRRPSLLYFYAEEGAGVRLQFPMPVD